MYTCPTWNLSKSDTLQEEVGKQLQRRSGIPIVWTPLKVQKWVSKPMILQGNKNKRKQVGISRRKSVPWTPLRAQKCPTQTPNPRLWKKWHWKKRKTKEKCLIAMTRALGVPLAVISELSFELLNAHTTVISILQVAVRGRPLLPLELHQARLIRLRLFG